MVHGETGLNRLHQYDDMMSDRPLSSETDAEQSGLTLNGAKHK
ncbi:hypothetical protein [Vacuolonema iberomarrocanum]